VLSTASQLELFPIRWNHLIDKEMRRNKGIERAFRSHLIGIRSSKDGTDKNPIFWRYDRASVQSGVRFQACGSTPDACDGKRSVIGFRDASGQSSNVMD